MSDKKLKQPEENKDKKEGEDKVNVVEGKRARRGVREKPVFDKDAWKPKTSVGQQVKSGEITDIDQILDKGINILEAGIVDVLMPNLITDLLLIGQSKGKFGGGQRRVFRQTQKKTREGNKPRFATLAIAGDEDGHIGIGYGKSRETVPAREKSLRNSKLNIIKIRRGCGSWECGCAHPHSIPYEVEGKVGSVKVKLIPAPKGTGLCIESECGKILKMAGITDIWSKTEGKTSTKINLIHACMKALKKLVDTKVRPQDVTKLGIVEGSASKKQPKFIEESVEEDKNESGNKK